LRLRQQYFFVSASLQNLIARHIRSFGSITNLAEKTAIQLNDTHPAIAIAEMVRILVDLHEVPWDEAWASAQNIFSYTNHTLLPEALETWPVSLMERLLPRHMQIIYKINNAHLEGLRETNPGDDALAPASPSSRKNTAAACGWAISPSSARTASTASPLCIPS